MATGWHGVAWPAGQRKPLLFRVIDPIKGLLEPYGLSVAECLDRVKEIVKAKPNGQDPAPTAGSRKNKRRDSPKIHNGDELTTMEFPPLRWAIEGILPAGATLFAGLPKKGKSRLTLNVGYAIASGGYALGKIKVDQGEVLYIALDDQKRRILDILKAMSPDGRIPTRLHVAFEWHRLGDGCEDELNDWLYHHREHARFVCLDVIKHVRQIGTNKNPYLEDYAVGDALRTIAEEYQAAIVGNHHANKLAYAIEETDDPMQAISGTSGLPGGFDNTMILYQRKGVATTFLHIEGNDTQNADLALEWDEHLLTWLIAGDAAEFTGGPEWLRARDLFKQHGPLGVLELAKLMYPNAEVVKDTREYNRVKNLVWKAKNSGRVIKRRFDGRFALPHDTTNLSSITTEVATPATPASPAPGGSLGLAYDYHEATPASDWKLMENLKKVSGGSHLPLEHGNGADFEPKEVRS